MLYRAASLLYDAGDPRAVPWPNRVDLGRMRSALRNVALGLHPHCDEPSASCETATEHQHPQSALQLAEQGVRRPRRAPQPPAIDPADLPDPDELARASRPNKFIRQ